MIIVILVSRDPNLDQRSIVVGALQIDSKKQSLLQTAYSQDRQDWKEKTVTQGYNHFSNVTRKKNLTHHIVLIIC